MIKVIIGAYVALIIIINNNKQTKNKPSIIPDEKSFENISTPINPIPEDENHIESEFQFKTEVKELRRINVKQKYSEKIVSNGVESIMNVIRNTNYEIFILSAKDPSEINKNNYNKLYTGAILINSQCSSYKDENCIPKNMIDISQFKKDNINNSLRYLNELPDFKDLPIPLCLFNITDNDVITSMTCPEKLQTNIKLNMYLDLNFFRPVAIKKDKNITVNKWKEGDKYYIREVYEGVCDIPESLNSFCTTDMNTTMDINGTLLTYDEETVTHITNDDENSFYKIKTTNLLDKSEELKNVDKNSYEEVLNNMISELSPYMIYNEKFSDEDFKELYNFSKNITNDKDSQRKLEENEIKTKESMKAFSNIFIDDTSKEISNFKRIF